MTLLNIFKAKGNTVSKRDTKFLTLKGLSCLCKYKIRSYNSHLAGRFFNGAEGNSVISTGIKKSKIV